MEHCVLPPAQLPRALASNTTLSDVVHGAGGAGGGGEGEQSALHTWRHCTLIRWGLLVAYVFHHMLLYRPSPSGSLSPRVKHPGKKGSFVPPQPGVPGGSLYDWLLRGCAESASWPTLKSRAASSHSSRVVISYPAGQMDVVREPQRTLVVTRWHWLCRLRALRGDAVATSAPVDAATKARTARGMQHRPAPTHPHRAHARATPPTSFTDALRKRSLSFYASVQVK